MSFGDEYPLDPVDAEPGQQPLPGEGRDPDLTDLHAAGDDMAPDTVRSLVEAQADTWRRVPALVLEVQGRTGYVDSYPAAYRTGYWQVSPEGYTWSNDNLPRVYVDCATGELVSASFIRTPPIPGDEMQEAVLDVLEANGDRLPQERIEEELAPQYGTNAVEDALQEMYRDGLSFGKNYEIVVERPEVAPASDDLVERMATHHSERLDAGKTVEWLEERANEPHSDIYDVEEQEAWRAHVREQLDLDPVYSRD